jgi:single-strand DNA-binding protein
MSNDLNHCSFIGRLGADPESRFLPSGEQVVSLRLAVGWKGKEKEGVEWVPISVFGRLAEICAEYLRKGSQVFVSGRFKTDKYQDKNGETRYSTKIVADRLQMLGSKQDREDAAPQPQRQQRPEPARQQQPVAETEAWDYDIPF